MPHVTQREKADITDLEALRQKFGKGLEARRSGKLTVTAVALKVVAAALKEFPQFNASVDMAGEAVIYKQYVHIGVAVDTDRGLLVPVMRDVDKKGILQLAAELDQLAEKARAGKLSLDEMQGGCFTITNLGGIGGTHFTPIVNHPEVAILGMSRSRMEPVWKDGQFVPRLMLPLSLSYDHRIIDGADAMRFLRFIVDRSSSRSCWCSSKWRPPPTSRSSAPDPAAIPPRSSPPTSACRSRSSTRRRTPAASASTAAASRRRRCSTSPRCSTRRGTPRSSASSSRRRASTSTSCAASRTASSRR